MLSNLIVYITMHELRYPTNVKVNVLCDLIHNVLTIMLVFAETGKIVIILKKENSKDTKNYRVTYLLSND